MYDIIHDIIFEKCISLTCYALQPPILPQHSVQMKPTTIMNQTDQWIWTRSVTMLIKALSLTWTWRKTLRSSHYS